MPKSKDQSQSPSIFAVLRTAAVWFVIGGIGTMLALYSLNLLIGALLPDSWNTGTD
jgi:hypothetical protein